LKVGFVAVTVLLLHFDLLLVFVLLLVLLLVLAYC